jgi:hypothetical protein
LLRTNPETQFVFAELAVAMFNVPEFTRRYPAFPPVERNWVLLEIEPITVVLPVPLSVSGVALAWTVAVFTVRFEIVRLVRF